LFDQDQEGEIGTSETGIVSGPTMRIEVAVLLILAVILGFALNEVLSFGVSTLQFAVGVTTLLFASLGLFALVNESGKLSLFANPSQEVTDSKEKPGKCDVRLHYPYIAQLTISSPLIIAGSPVTAVSEPDLMSEEYEPEKERHRSQSFGERIISTVHG
jgi:hypothetical protein